MRPIYTLEDLGAAATDAAALVRAGEVSRAQAADDLQDMAVATGLLERYGADAVQHFISDALRTPNGAPVIASDSEQLARKTENELCAPTLGQLSTTPRVSAINLDRFLKMDIPPRATMLTPWLPVQGLAMIYAPRGTGKTRVAHGVCHAIATGSGFLRWTAPKASRVLLLDGEMPAAVLQEMLHSTVQASRCAMPDPTFFKVAAADLVREGLPDLATTAGQAFYREVIADADLAVIDNISTICLSLKENDADGWTPVQSWALSLRRAGKSALFIHHGGKSGAQRGTSRKEDVRRNEITVALIKLMHASICIKCIMSRQHRPILAAWCIWCIGAHAPDRIQAELSGKWRSIRLCANSRSGALMQWCMHQSRPSAVAIPPCSFLRNTGFPLRGFFCNTEHVELK